MAIKACKECGGQVSDKAETCPACGAKQPKKTSFVTWAVLVLVVLTVIMAMMSPSDGTSSSGTSTSSSMSTEERTAAALLAYAKMQIKDGAKDSSSVEFRNESYHTDEKYGAVACGEFNAKNSFGAYTGFKGFVATEKDAKLYMQGVTKVSNEFVERWNNLCVKSN